MKCVLIILFVIVGMCESSVIKDNLKDNSTHDEEYDQRQSGSENYRINVDGVVIAIAPAEEVLSAVSNINLSDVLQLADDSPPIHKNPSKPVITLLSSNSKPTGESPAESKSSEKKSNNRFGQRLISIIKPFLRRSHSPH